MKEAGCPAVGRRPSFVPKLVEELSPRAGIILEEPPQLPDFDLDPFTRVFPAVIPGRHVGTGDAGPPDKAGELGRGLSFREEV